MGLALTGILALVSCSQEDEGIVSQDSTVAITVNPPESFTRAGGDASAVDFLQYAILDITGDTPKVIENETLENLTFPLSLNLQLITNHTYGMVFWAGSQNAPYEIDLGAGTMSVDYSETTANTDVLDAFYFYSTLNVSGNSSLNVTLQRPFAMVNIGISTDVTSNVQSSITVEGAATGLNLFTGELVGSAEATFGYSQVPQNMTYPVVGYNELAYAFILAPKSASADYNLTFSYKEGTSEAVSTTANGVTLQANYKTNIYK